MNLTRQYDISLPVPYRADQRTNRRLKETSPMYNGIDVRNGDFRVVDTGNDNDFIDEMMNRPGAVATRMRLVNWGHPFRPPWYLPDFRGESALVQLYEGDQVVIPVSSGQVYTHVLRDTGTRPTNTEFGNFVMDGDWKVQFTPHNQPSAAGVTRKIIIRINGVDVPLYVQGPDPNPTALTEDTVRVGEAMRFTPVSNVVSGTEYHISTNTDERINVERSGDDLVVYGLSSGDVRLYLNTYPPTGDGVRRVYDMSVEQALPEGSTIDLEGLSFDVSPIQVGETVKFVMKDWISPVTASSALPSVTTSVSNVVTTSVVKSSTNDSVVLSLTGAAGVTQSTDVVVTVLEGTASRAGLNVRVIPRRPRSVTGVVNGKAVQNLSYFVDGFVLLPNEDRTIDLTEYDWRDFLSDFDTGDDIGDVTITASGDDELVLITITGTSMRLQAGIGTARAAGQIISTLFLENSTGEDDLDLNFNVIVLESSGGVPPRFDVSPSARIEPVVTADPFVPASSLVDDPQLPRHVVAETHGVLDSVQMLDDGSFRITELSAFLGGTFKLQRINTPGPYYEHSELLYIPNTQGIIDVEIDFPHVKQRT